MRRRPLPVLAVVVATACGSHLPGLSKKSSSAVLGGAGDAQDAGTTGLFSFTAAYQTPPLDLIIIRDQASHAAPFDQRIDEAAPVLAALLWNLHDVRVGVYDDVFDPPAPDQPPPAVPVPLTALPITDPKVADRILDPAKLSAIAFSDALSARIGAAGNRGGTYLPASVLMALNAESKKPPGGGLVAEFIRPGAFMAVLVIGATLDPADPYDASDVVTAYQPLGANFMVSALTLDDGGCTVVDTTPPLVVNKDKTPQRNLEMKLQKATQGRFGSLCSNVTYSLFMTDVVTNGTGTAYFPVTLPQPVDGSTIKITANGVNVPDFRYVAGTTTLEVSTTVANGTSFTVQATPIGPPPEVTTGTAPNVDNVPQVSNAPTSPAALAFATNVQPSVQSICGPCHSGRPFNSDQGFVAAVAYQSQIASYLALPVSDPLHMPPGVDLKTTNPAAFNAIDGWATAPIQ